MFEVLHRKLQELTGQPSWRLEWTLAFLPLVWVTVWFGLNMQVLGARLHHFGGREMRFGLELDYAMGVLWWLVLAIAILVLGGKSRRMLLLAWIGKFFVVLVAMLFYEQRYDLDAYTYFITGATGRYWMYPGIDFRSDLLPSFYPTQLASGDWGLPHTIGTENFARFVVLMASVTGPFYHAMKVGFAFLGLLGVWWFYRAVEIVLERPYPPAFYLLAFFPSILFWSSILGKDPLQFLFLGLYAYGGAVWLIQGRLGAFRYLGVALLGSYFLRPWIAFAAVLALGVATLLGKCRPWQTYLVFLVVVSGLFLVTPEAVERRLGADLLNEPHLLIEILQLKAEGFAEGGGSRAKLSTTLSAETLPLAMFTGLFRPLPFDITSPFIALAAVENSIVLALALIALVRFRLTYLRDPVIIWPIAFCLLWSLLYGFIVTANFGSGMRYKLQALPFLLMVIMCLVHREGRALLDARMLRSRKRLGRPEA